MASNEKNIQSFSIAGNIGIITVNDILVEVPYGTDITTLVSTFILSNYANAFISTVPQISSVTINDFTTFLNYRIVAEDLSEKIYTITVIVTPPSSEKKILSFTFEDGSALINETSKSIVLSVSSQIDLTNILPVLEISEFATVNPLSEVVTDFTSSVIYTVTAQDGSTQIYIVSTSIVANHSAYLDIFKMIRLRLPFVADTSENRDMVSSFVLEVMYEMETCFKVSVLDDGTEDETRIGNELYYSIPQKSIIADIVSMLLLRRLAVYNVAGTSEQTTTQTPVGNKYIKTAEAGSVSVSYDLLKIDNTAYVALDTPRLLDILKSDIVRKLSKLGCIYDITESCELVACINNTELPLFITSGRAL